MDPVDPQGEPDPVAALSPGPLRDALAAVPPAERGAVIALIADTAYTTPRVVTGKE